MRLDLSNRLPLAFALLDLEAVFPIQLTYIGLEMTHFSAMRDHYLVFSQQTN